MIITKLICDKTLWEQFVLSYPGGNFLQSWNWGELQKNLGNKIFRLGFFNEEKLNGVGLLIKQEARRGTYLECPGGPLIYWDKLGYFEEFVKTIKKLGKEENCVFVRVRPQLLEALSVSLFFKKQGFVSSPMHLHAENTLQLNLLKTEDQLLKEMRKNTRYLIKRAVKEGVAISVSNEGADIKTLYQLQLETVGRRHFVPFKEEYFRKEFEAFSSDNQIKIYKAIYQGKVIAISLIIFYGKEAVYHYSGSSSSFRKIPASYLLQWEAIKEAKRRGCEKYNF